MEIDRALDQIAQIHQHLERTELYRGYRSATMAVTAGVAVLGGVLQPRLVPDGDGHAFVTFWLALAALNVLVVAGEIAADWLLLLTARQQRMTWRVVSQFLPSLAGGALLSWAFLQVHGGAALLPGSWALVFALGVLASRPYLPRGVGWVGLYYVVAGAGLLTLAPMGLALHPWAMGTCFALGQAYLAAVLYWNLERHGN